MHERAEELGGRCRIEPAVPHGTRVLVELPVAPA
jgi:signal transduction histidine kinase